MALHTAGKPRRGGGLLRRDQGADGSVNDGRKARKGLVSNAGGLHQGRKAGVR